MANSPNPDYVPEMMKRDFGTEVLITNPLADRYLRMSIESRESRECENQRFAKN